VKKIKIKWAKNLGAVISGKQAHSKEIVYGKV
jgi:hypothetical protein